MYWYKYWAKKLKKTLKKTLFKQIKYSAFGKISKLVTTEKKRKQFGICSNSLVVFSKHLLAIEMKKTQILMNELVYLGLSLLELSKTVM